MVQRMAIKCRTNGGCLIASIRQWKRPAPVVPRVFCIRAEGLTTATPADSYQDAAKPSPLKVFRPHVSVTLRTEVNRRSPSAGGTLEPTSVAAPSTRKDPAGVAVIRGSSRLTSVLEAIGNSDAERRTGRKIEVDSGGRFIRSPSPTRSFKRKIRHQAKAMLALALPRGFPDSVCSPYAEYATWQFLGMTASAAAGVMSTQSLLFAMGLGAGSAPLAATMNWVIKDGLGQLGGVAFSSLVNTLFDSNPRLWRLIAVICMDLSMVMEILSPLAPGHFLLIASVANVGKNISFLAASASSAAIHNILSAKGNLADVTAKAGAQNIIACMIGTGMGIMLSSLLGHDFRGIVSTCLLLSALHLSATYTAVRRIGVPTFDPRRLELVVDIFRKSQTMPTPRDLAEQERFITYALSKQLGLDTSPKVTVGSRLEEAVKNREEIERLCQACEGLPFLLSVRGDLSAGTGEVHVLLLEGCGPRDVLAGSYLGHIAKDVLLERSLRRPRWTTPSPVLAVKAPSPLGEVLSDVVAEALRRGAVSSVYPSFAIQKALPQDSRKSSVANFISSAESAGWDTSVLFLERPGAARLRLFHGDAPNP